jgi:hypothetical protein
MSEELPLKTDLPSLSIAFLRGMQDELDANARKGDWNSLKLPPDECGRWLFEHVVKLNDALGAIGSQGDAIPRRQIREFAADLANVAMKIDELFGPERGREEIDRVRLLPKAPPR